MVYIRAKKVKSDRYLYLVKSVWDSKRGTSRQEIVKYLGKASEVVKEDIPKEYRNDPKVMSALASFSPEDIKKREDAARRARRQLYKRLTEGSIQDSMRVYGEYSRVFSAPSFFDKILRPVMRKIGEDWASKKISIATEHVASNVAQTLVKIIMEQVAPSGKKKKVMICVPLGEEHHLGCDVLETYLSIKGFRVFNMGTSIPTESILDFIGSNRPDVVLVSITLRDNLMAGQRLVRRIRDRYDIPVLIGGYAMQSHGLPKFDGRVIGEVGLEEIPKIIRRP